MTRWSPFSTSRPAPRTPPQRTLLWSLTDNVIAWLEPTKQCNIACDGCYELRQWYADMVAEVGRISCAFNATVYEQTLRYVPDLVAWAQRNPAKVQVMVFIAFRAEDTRFEYRAGSKTVETRELAYRGGRTERIDITAREIAASIHARFRGYRPAAYLNGTESPDSFKWLMSLVVNDGDEILGAWAPASWS